MSKGSSGNNLSAAVIGIGIAAIIYGAGVVLGWW